MQKFLVGDSSRVRILNLFAMLCKFVSKWKWNVRLKFWSNYRSLGCDVCMFLTSNKKEQQQPSLILLLKLHSTKELFSVAVESPFLTPCQSKSAAISPLKPSWLKVWQQIPAVCAIRSFIYICLNWSLLRQTYVPSKAVLLSTEVQVYSSSQGSRPIKPAAVRCPCRNSLVNPSLIEKMDVPYSFCVYKQNRGRLQMAPCVYLNWHVCSGAEMEETKPPEASPQCACAHVRASACVCTGHAVTRMFVSAPTCAPLFDVRLSLFG